MMNILDSFELQKNEIKYEKKRLALGFLVQASTISILIILLIMSQNIVNIFDQYYHEQVADHYNVTIENIDYSDISYLSKMGYSNMYVYMPNFEKYELYYQGSVLPMSYLNLVCNDATLSGSEIIEGRGYHEADNLNKKYVAWVSKEMSHENSIAVGEEIQCEIEESKMISFTVVGVISGLHDDDIFIPFHTFLSDASVEGSNIKFCLSAETKSIMNYDTVKFRLGCKNEYMTFDELDNIFSLVFFMKSIFVGLSFISVALCFISISNICGLHVSNRKKYINMLYQLGMSATKIKSVFFNIYLYNIIFSVICAKMIADAYLKYFNQIIKKEFGNICVESDNILFIIFLVFFVFIIVTRIIISKAFENIITTHQDEVT